MQLVCSSTPDTDTFTPTQVSQSNTLEAAAGILPTYSEMLFFFFLIGKDWVTVYRLFTHIPFVPAEEASVLLRGFGVIARRGRQGKG